MRKSIVGFSLFAALLLTLTSALVAEILPRNIVVQQSNCPIRISSYRAAYKPDTGLRHTIKYENRSGQKVVAMMGGMGRTFRQPLRRNDTGRGSFPHSDQVKAE